MRISDGSSDVCSSDLDLARRVVARLALLVVVAPARGIQQLVDLRITVLGIVDAALAGQELVDVAVRVDAARPADLAGLIVAGGLLGQQAGELHRLQGDRKSTRLNSSH